MTDLHQNLINGEWVGGEAAEDINPSNTNDVIGEFASGSKADADKAVAAAKAAFHDWSRSNPQLRHDILQKASNEVMARKEELGRILAREEGKTLAEGIGEATRAGQILDFFAGEALRLAGEMLPSVLKRLDRGDRTVIGRCALAADRPPPIDRVVTASIGAPESGGATVRVTTFIDGRPVTRVWDVPQMR